MTPRFQITNRVTADLTRIERARGFLDAAKLSEDWLATMRSRALLLEAHHTAHIEGTHLTLIKADLLARKHGLNERQSAALRFLLEHGKMTIQDFEAQCPTANRRRLQRDLKALLDKWLFRDAGMSPTDPNRVYSRGPLMEA